MTANASSAPTFEEILYSDFSFAFRLDTDAFKSKNVLGHLSAFIKLLRDPILRILSSLRATGNLENRSTACVA